MKDIHAIPSNVQSARQEALLYVFEDNEVVIKISLKEGVSPVLCLGRILQHPESKLGREGLKGSHPTKGTKIMMVSMESRLNSSGIFSQDSHRCSSVTRSAIF